MAVIVGLSHAAAAVSDSYMIVYPHTLTIVDTQDIDKVLISTPINFKTFCYHMRCAFWNAQLTRAGVAELADAPDLGSGIERCEGSSPFARTT